MECGWGLHEVMWLIRGGGLYFGLERRTLIILLLWPLFIWDTVYIIYVCSYVVVISLHGDSDCTLCSEKIPAQFLSYLRD